MNNNRININSDDYQKLDDISKLKIVRDYLYELFETKNKKTITVYHRGKKKNIPKEKQGVFKNLCEREKHLEKVIKNLSIDEHRKNKSNKFDNISETINETRNQLNETIESKKNFEYNPDKPLITPKYEERSTIVSSQILSKIKKEDEYIGKYLKKEEQVLETKNLNNKEYTKLYIGKYLKKEDLTPRELEQITPVSKETEHKEPIIKIQKRKVKKQITKNFIKLLKDKYKKLNKKIIIDKQTTKEISNIVNNTIVKTNNKTLKNQINKTYNRVKNTLNKFIHSKQENNKNNIQIKINSRTKKLAVGFCAILLTVTLIPTCRNNKKNTQNNNPNKETTSQNTNIETTIPSTSIDETTKPTMPQETIKPVVPVTKPNNNNNVQKPNENFSDEENISFDDKVTINKNSFIYTNSYDATYKTNSLKPYFTDNEEREIQGLVYELNGQIYIIYETEENAIQKQKKLEEKGAQITAVLVTKTTLSETNLYEGYYNIDSVKVKSKTK